MCLIVWYLNSIFEILQEISFQFKTYQMGIKEGEWYEKYIHMYVFVREGVKKKK